MANRTVLHVSGFSPDLRARDLAYEFERYGRLVRCDIPALKTPTSAPFAFVEFRREDDAEDAYYDMHGRSIDGSRISVQWAKRPPSSAWRHDGFSRDRRTQPREDRSRRSPPPRRGRSPPLEDREGSRHKSVHQSRRRSVSMSRSPDRSKTNSRAEDQEEDRRGERRSDARQDQNGRVATSVDRN